MLLATLLALLTITSMNVHYGYTNVTVTVNYSLSDLQKVGVFLFGAKNIEKEIIGIFNATNFQIERIDMNKAIFRFNVTDCGNYVFFGGVKLNGRFNLTLTFPGNVTLTLNDTDMIPEVYLFK